MKPEVKPWTQEDEKVLPPHLKQTWTPFKPKVTEKQKEKNDGN